ncbi:hypothetical protein FAI41_05545 [Acetobacteraceae bacterium]|nr:hypothetical protein FAI41_05545 [Acetobacteraceae bacterium]
MYLPFLVPDRLPKKRFWLRFYLNLKHKEEKTEKTSVSSKRLCASPPRFIILSAMIYCGFLHPHRVRSAEIGEASDLNSLQKLEAKMSRLKRDLTLLQEKQQRENEQLRVELTKEREETESDPYQGADIDPPQKITELAAPPTFTQIEEHRAHTTNAAWKSTAPLDDLKTNLLAKPDTAHTFFGELTDTPAAHTDLKSPLRRGQLQMGGLRITLGGFVDFDMFWRSRKMSADQNSDWRNIPWGDSSDHDTSEFQLTARHSRISALVEGQVSQHTTIDGYGEMDFESSGSMSNSRGSNPYTPRMRVAYAELKNTHSGWFLLGGQNWSLMTMNAKGMLARDEAVPLTVDANYVPGFTYTRAPQIRVVKAFGIHGNRERFSIGASLEDPSATAPSTTPNIPGVGTITDRHTGTGTNNTQTYYAGEYAPDFIMKATADPAWGHFEAEGVMRYFHDTTTQYDAANQTGSNRGHTAIGGGGGGGFILPFLHNKLSFMASGIVGAGIGRYGSAQMPDYTYNPDGSIRPLPEANVLTGVVFNPLKWAQLYGYWGMEKVLHRESFQAGGQPFGYGNPNYNMSGCYQEGSGNCPAEGNLNYISQATGGIWFTPIQGDYGTIKTGVQYSYTWEQAYGGIGGKPRNDENTVFFDIRYMPFG